MYYLILGIVAIIAIALGARTDLLKDIVVDKDTLTKHAVEQGVKPIAPFSWSRTQLAFWTVIIFSSFLYLLFKYRFSIPELNNVNLILLGIAVATTASAKLIDDSQKNNPDLSQNYPSKGFLYDILSDKNGVSIHRLQNLLWTLAVGIIYMQYVGVQKGMPDETVLTQNLLILMGISTGAYIGIKTTENSKQTIR
jgi:hypothetical protein